MGLVDKLVGKSVYLDTNALIYFLRGDGPLANVTYELFGALSSGLVAGKTSELTLGEVLVQPMRSGDHDVISFCHQVFEKRIYFEPLPITRHIVVNAARIRAEFQLKLADAIHASTAMIGGCDFLVTNDRSFERLSLPRPVLQSAYVEQ